MWTNCLKRQAAQEEDLLHVGDIGMKERSDLGVHNVFDLKLCEFTHHGFYAVRGRELTCEIPLGSTAMKFCGYS